MENLILKIEKWAEDRNFFDKENGASIEAQYIKLYEEFGELCKNYTRGRSISDDIGDNMVVLAILARLHGTSLVRFIGDHEIGGSIEKSMINITGMSYPMLLNKHNPDFFPAIVDLSTIALAAGTTLKESLSIAYDEIKDRKGRFINHVFVKSESIG